MGDYINVKYVVDAALFSAIGLAVFIVSFVVLDLLTPRVNFWRELVEQKNIAVAILLGACMIGISIIIASAIHG